MAEGSRKEEGLAAAMSNSDSQGSDLRDLNCEQLAWRSQQGSRAAFAELIGRYSDKLLLFLSCRTNNRQDAEDLVQDTLARAYQNIHLYSDRWKFSTWLFTIARRLASSHYRRRRHCVIAEEPAASSLDPARLVAAQEGRDNLWTLARQLPESQFQALWLRYSDGMSLRQIAGVMGKSQVAAKVLLYRARVNLAKRLETADHGILTLSHNRSRYTDTEVRKCSVGFTNS